MKHVLITGGSDGLGKVTAQQMLKAGFKVTILSKNEEKTKAAADEIGASYVVADVSDAKAVRQAIAKAETSAPIDILINNAGLWIQGPLDENDAEKIHEVLHVNTLGVIYCTQAVLPLMKPRKAGRIINIISQAGLSAKAERSVYNASKWALTGFVKSMQAELKPFNICMDGIYPGAIANTNLFNAAGNPRDMSKGVDPVIIANAISYTCNLPDGVNVTELGLNNLAY